MMTVGIFSSHLGNVNERSAISSGSIAVTAFAAAGESFQKVWAASVRIGTIMEGATTPWRGLPMPEAPAVLLLHRIRRLVDGSNARSLTDRVLLERSTQARDESAFEQLLRRHGPIVLGVCRRLLRSE